jgi:ferrous iron transport protein B
MGVLFGSGHVHENGAKPNLQKILQEDRIKDGPRMGEKTFTPLVGASYLLFILIYMPCVAVVATVKKESGSWRWTLFLVTYTTGLAWLLSFGVYQVGSMLNL